MFKNYFSLLVLSVVFCYVNGWRVFPLPDAPVQPAYVVKPTPVLPRLPTTTSNSIFSPHNFVKPTPVLPQFPVKSTGNYSPNKFNVRPQSVQPVLSTQDVPSSDLLPPKTEYTEYEP